ncbi:MAG: hypothetical protein SGBAC_009414, partial [Bacillariaceae sp.]
MMQIDFHQQSVSRAIVTVPAYFNDDQRQATKDAGRIAGLTVKRIINDLTAAAISYGMKKNMDYKNVLGTLGKSSNSRTMPWLSLEKLLKEVERVKRALSTQRQAGLEVDDVISGRDLQETQTRARFEELNEVLNRSNLSKQDVDQIVLVGGSTRIPQIQKLLSDHFGGKELSKSINPDKAVAQGAAVQRAIRNSNVEVKDLLLLVKISLSKGIET